jgi:hypothetical protein
LCGLPFSGSTNKGSGFTVARERWWIPETKEEEEPKATAFVKDPSSTSKQSLEGIVVVTFGDSLLIWALRGRCLVVGVHV